MDLPIRSYNIHLMIKDFSSLCEELMVIRNIIIRNLDLIKQTN
ncbi:2627_t:CDS:1, partial [Entrophospora sp. SA101]